VAVLLAESAQAAVPEPFRVDCRSAGEARLAEAFVEALAKRLAGDLRVEVAAEARVAVPLEGGVRPPPVRKQVRSGGVLRAERVRCKIHT